jgi:phage terminase large subunit-like protein
MTKLSPSDFAEHVLKTPLWPKQKEILNELFDQNISHAIWSMGRRSGKTFMASVAATYMAFCQDDYFRRKVRKNEKYYIITVANDRLQSKIALDNIRQLVLGSPLEQEIIRETAMEIELSNGCIFQAIPASARASRGKAVVGVVMDELAFSLDGDANRGAEAMYTALAPSIAQFGKHGKIIELSSPWLSSGLFFNHFKQAQSGEFPGMVARQIPTWEININLPYDGKKEVSIQAVEDWIREHHKIYQFDSIVLDQFNSSATIQSLNTDFPIRELTWSVSTKMKAFSKMKELFNAGLVDIYPHERAIRQLKNLNVLYRQSGQWSVTGGKESGVDDFCFALAAAMLEASKEDDLHWLESLVR